MQKFIVDVVHDFVISLQPDVGREFLHVSNVFLYISEVVGWFTNWNCPMVAEASLLGKAESKAQIYHRPIRRIAST